MDLKWKKPDGRIRWNADLEWKNLLLHDRTGLANELGGSSEYLRQRAKRWSHLLPGGADNDALCDPEIYKQTLIMIENVQSELLLAIGYVKNCDILWSWSLSVQRRFW